MLVPLIPQASLCPLKRGNSKDILTGLAAVTAAVVAVLGFRTWKKQLQWKTKYDLAQRLVWATYKVKHALDEVRRAYPILEELREGNETNIKVSQESQRTFSQSQRAVYEKRWQKVVKAYAELDTVSLEAEALWGQDLKRVLVPLSDCVATLSQTLADYLDNLDKTPIQLDDVYKPGQVQLIRSKPTIRQILFSNPHEVNNPFSDEIADAVDRVDYVIKYLLER